MQDASTGSGLLPSNLGNQELKPEVTTEIEGGFEAGLFNNKAQLSATYWGRRLDDALVQKAYAVSGGFSARQLTNVGRMDARGVELSLNGFVVNRPNVGVDLFANGSYLWQKVVSLGGTTDRPDGSTYHITWSLADGREAKESNDVLRDRGWEPFDLAMPVRLMPARLR